MRSEREAPQKLIRHSNIASAWAQLSKLECQRALQPKKSEIMKKQDRRWNADKPSAALDPYIPTWLTTSPANYRPANFWFFFFKHWKNNLWPHCWLAAPCEDQGMIPWFYPTLGSSCLLEMDTHHYEVFVLMMEIWVLCLWTILRLEDYISGQCYNLMHAWVSSANPLTPFLCWHCLLDHA